MTKHSRSREKLFGDLVGSMRFASFTSIPDWSSSSPQWNGWRWRTLTQDVLPRIQEIDRCSWSSPLWMSTSRRNWSCCWKKSTSLAFVEILCPEKTCIRFTSRNELPTIAFDPRRKTNAIDWFMSKHLKACDEYLLKSSSKCIGAQTLMGLLSNCCRMHYSKTTID